MRDGIEALLSSLHPKDAKTMRKAGMLQNYAGLAEDLPVGETYLAVIPTVHGRGQAVMAVTPEKLLCRGQFDEDFSLILRNIEHLQLATMGVIKTKPYRLDVQRAGGVLPAGWGLLCNSAGWARSTRS